MTIKLYKYLGAAININKGPLLSNPLTITDSHIAGNQDMEAPILVISADGANAALDYNYVYIQDWSRYYFITKRTWLADGCYQIYLQEDYIYTAATLVYAQTGLCRYSGLGDKNLPDSRIQLKPTSTIAEWPINPVNGGGTYWYVVKFLSEQPMVGATSNKATVNIAIMNEGAYTGFTAAYKTKSETARVKISACIISVYRVKYIDPNSTMLGASVYQIRFKSPYDTSGTDETVIWSATDGELCYIITSPQEVYRITPVIMQVSTTAGSGPVKNFNTGGHFWELNAQYILRLAELQPIPFTPAALGLGTNFQIYVSIVYEPYGENYVIMFGKYVGADFIPYGHAPIAQRCQTAITFITDNTLNLYQEATMANTLALFGGMTGSAIKAGMGLAAGDIGGALGGVIGMLGTGNNYVMREKQLQVSEFAGMGLTGTVGGSIDWTSYAMFSTNKCYVITQEPVTNYGGWWGRHGIPDGAWRPLTSLSGTGYAEIDLVDVEGNNSYYTDGEIQKIIDQLAAGVIFNAS